MDPSAESFGHVRSDPSWEEGDLKTEEEVEESSEEDEPASCSKREDFVRAAIKKHQSRERQGDSVVAKYHAQKYQRMMQRKDRLRRWAQKAGMYKGEQVNLITNIKGSVQNQCRACVVSKLIEKCNCEKRGAKCSAESTATKSGYAQFCTESAETAPCEDT